ncbi:MAG TPA: hypothetical protein G4O11_04900 [Anaerolineae bacterium]|nr:hypothetical protein [Anaerolineae bacterium]
MEPYWGGWIVLVLNGIMIALILTAPLLVGILIIRVLRRGVTDDRRAFEDDIRSKLGEITESQAEMKKQLDELSRR